MLDCIGSKAVALNHNPQCLFVLIDSTDSVVDNTEISLKQMQTVVTTL